MGCCPSKHSQSSQSSIVKKYSEIFPLKSLKPNGALAMAETMNKTPNGATIMKDRKEIAKKSDLQKLGSDPAIDDDFRKILRPPFSKVSRLTDYVYLTGIGGLTYENLTDLQINLVINATYEWPNSLMPGVQCIRVPVDDEINEDLSPYFDEVSEIIEEVAQKNGRTLVHCMAGASRSTTLVLAYLIRYESISLKNAFKSVQKRRETARPNISFWEQLIRYEMKSRKKTSVKMISVIRDNITATLPDFYEKDYPNLFEQEITKQRKQKQDSLSLKAYKETKNSFGQKLKDK